MPALLVDDGFLCVLLRHFRHLLIEFCYCRVLIQEIKLAGLGKKSMVAGIVIAFCVNEDTILLVFPQHQQAVPGSVRILTHGSTVFGNKIILRQR